MSLEIIIINLFGKYAYPGCYIYDVSTFVTPIFLQVSFVFGKVLESTSKTLARKICAIRQDSFLDPT